MSWPEFKPTNPKPVQFLQNSGTHLIYSPTRRAIPNHLCEGSELRYFGSLCFQRFWFSFLFIYLEDLYSFLISLCACNIIVGLIEWWMHFSTTFLISICLLELLVWLLWLKWDAILSLCELWPIGFTQPWCVG